MLRPPPPRWSRCIDGSALARQQDSGSGVVLVKLADRSSSRDPDLVLNCSICRHAATVSGGGGGGGGVQRCVDTQPVTDQTDDDNDGDQVQCPSTLDTGQFDHY